MKHIKITKYDQDPKRVGHNITIKVLTKKRKPISAGPDSDKPPRNRSTGNQPSLRSIVMNLQTTLEKFMVRQEKFDQYVIDVFERNKLR